MMKSSHKIFSMRLFQPVLNLKQIQKVIFLWIFNKYTKPDIRYNCFVIIWQGYSGLKGCVFGLWKKVWKLSLIWTKVPFLHTRGPSSKSAWVANPYRSSFWKSTVQASIWYAALDRGRANRSKIGQWNWIILHVFQWDSYLGWWDHNRF